MRLIQQPDWPADLARTYDHDMLAAGLALKAGERAAALEDLEKAYRTLLEAQPEGRRFHKGGSLHDAGLQRMYLGDGRGALEYTLMAFVEDALSLAEEQPRLEELDRPAAHNLVYVFAVPGPALATLAVWIRRVVGFGWYVPDPAEFLKRPELRDVLSLAAAHSGKRIPGLFGSPVEKRVFVGGYYGEGLLDTTLRPIRDHVDHLGYDGILVDDFSIPAEMGTDEHSIMLLLSSYFAIFDFTHRGGQEEEFGKLPDTMRKRALVIYDARAPGAPNVSGGMTKEKMTRWAVEAEGFNSTAEMLQTVETFLTLASIRPGGGAAE
jgi:hypothetical protein